MKPPVPVPTPESLAAHLRATPGSKERFGATTAAVQETAALVAAANSSWDKGAITAFQDQQKIHAKVWGKLVSIARCDALGTLLHEDLPASYTALYALVVMSPQERAAAVSEGLLKVKELSSRAILDWTKAYRLRGTGIEQEIPLTLVLTQDLTPEQQKDLLSALGKTAAQFGAQVLKGKGGIKQAELKADQRKGKAEEIEEELMRLLGPVVLEAPVALKRQFQVSSAADLISGPRQMFTGFFQKLVNKVDGVFWKEYGRAYCLKLAREFNLTESRAERYQLKKRVTDAIKWWAPKIDEFEAMANEVLATYMRR